MKILPPIEITDSLLISSSVPEDDYAVWAAGTAYVAGDRVIVLATHKIYEALQSTTGHSPPAYLTGTSPRWLEVGATNRWRMLDRQVGSQTAATGDLVLTIDCSGQGYVALLMMEAVSLDLEVYDNEEEAVIFEKSIDLQTSSHIIDFYTYIFSPFLYLRNIVISIPNVYSGELTITLHSDLAKCGELLLGNVLNLGCTNFGADVGIKDYSMKEVDDFGNYSILQRAFSKTGAFDLTISSFELEYIYNTLATYRSTPVLWLPTDAEFYSSTTMIYGFYKDFNITIQYFNSCSCSLEVEGLL
jgi:hypothetical protein